MFLKKLLVLSLIVVIGLSAIAQDNNELFWKAAKDNDVESLQKLLDQGVDVNATTDYGATALTYASDKGNVEATVFLLKNGADPNIRDLFYQSTPFNWSLYKENKDIIKAMIEHGADVNSPGFIRWASNSDDVELIKLVLQKGCEGANQILYGAIKNGKAEMSTMILEEAQIKEEDLTSILLLAVALENNDLVEILKSKGAKLPVKKEGDITGNLELFTGYFEGESGSVRLNLMEGLLAATFSTRPFKLLHKEDLIFTFLDYPDLTMTFAEVEGQIISVEFKQGGNVDKYVKMEEPVAQVADKDAEETKTVENDKSKVENPINWPSFRGEQASGVADGQYPPTIWNMDDNTNLKWKTYIPGLAHACPIVWEDKMYVITAISQDTTAEYRVGLFGDVYYVDDQSIHTWKMYCLDKNSGDILWEKMAYEGVPRVKRHSKATQANSTPATNGEYVVALYGSEGLVCYDMDGNEKWRKDLGKLDAGWFFDEETEWGHSSSPIIYKNLAIVQCDRSKDSYIAAYDLKTGEEVWRTEREEISSWGTPTIYYGEDHDEVVTHATKFIRAYDPNTGEELWRLGPNSEVTVATPVVYNDLIYVTAGYPPIRPVYVIKPGGRGDISIADSLNSGEFIKWRTKRGGTYMPSPIAYDGYFYTLANNGLLTCYDAEIGEQKYRERVRGGAFTASIVAADGKLYCTSEERGIFVIKAGPEFEVITSNQIGEICLSTPVITDGKIYVRGQHHIFCISR